MTEGALILGYGNPLRSDDGVGWQAVGFLKKDARLTGANFLARHQLTPELAEDFSKARLVVLIDASVEHVPGSVQVRKVELDSRAASSLSHQLDPGTLQSMTERLYGSAPPIFVVTVGAACLDPGETLSSAAGSALPEVARTVARIARCGADGRETDRILRP